MREVLYELREHLRMDAIFLSEIRDGQRTFRHVDARPGAEVIAAGLESSYCQMVIDGRLPQLVHDAAVNSGSDRLPAAPFRVGAYLSVPVVLADGRIYGTLCPFSLAGDPTLTERELAKLLSVARVKARRIDLRLQHVRDAERVHWQLEPLASPPTALGARAGAPALKRRFNRSRAPARG